MTEVIDKILIIIPNKNYIETICYNSSFKSPMQEEIIMKYIKENNRIIRLEVEKNWRKEYEIKANNIY